MVVVVVLVAVVVVIGSRSRWNEQFVPRGPHPHPVKAGRTVYVERLKVEVNLDERDEFRSTTDDLKRTHKE